MRNNNPLVSVVMPTFNHAQYVGHAIESILSQTYENIELIVINDGSKDKTLEKVKSFNDPRLKIIDQENSGPSTAVNNGIKAANGEWIALMSGDDVCLPNRIESQVAEALKSASETVFFSHVLFVNEENIEIPSPFPPNIFNTNISTTNEIYKRFFTDGNFLAAPTAFFPKTLFRKTPGMDVSSFQLQDYMLWLEFLKFAEFKIIQRPLIKYRIHPASLSSAGSSREIALENELYFSTENLLSPLSDARFKEIFKYELFDRDFTTPLERVFEEGLIYWEHERTFMKVRGAELIRKALNMPGGLELAKTKYKLSPTDFWNRMQSTLIFFDPKALNYLRHLERQNHDVLKELNIFHQKSSRVSYKVMEQIIRLSDHFNWFKKTILNSIRFLRKHSKASKTTIQLFWRNIPQKLTLFTSKIVGLFSSADSQERFLIKATHQLSKIDNIYEQLVKIYQSSGRELLASEIMIRRLLRGWPIPFDSKIERLITDNYGKFISLIIGRKYFPQIFQAQSNSGQPNHPHSLNFSAQITPIEKYCSEHNQRLQILKGSDFFKFKLPMVFGEQSDNKESQVKVPSSWLAYLKDVDLAGGYCVFNGQRLILYEPAANPELGSVSGCWQFLAAKRGYSSMARYKYSAKTVEYHEKAILLSGRCSQNYYHWLLEYLPKFLEIDSQPELAHLPLIVDTSMPIQHYQALLLIAGKDRDFLGFNSEKMLKFKDLIIPSISTYLPDRFDIPYWHSAAISVEHLKYLREKILRGIMDYETDASFFPEKIYLSRKNIQGRSIINEPEIEKFFVDLGFKKMYLEQLSFIEQVETIKNAKFIAGPSGAGLSNLLFCSSTTKIVSFTSQRNKAFCNFANLAKLNQAEFTYITGPNEFPREHFSSEEEFAHSRFSVSLKKIQDFVRTEWNLSF